MTSNEPHLRTNRWPRRPRLKGFAYDGDHAYHITFATAARRRVLVGPLADQVVRSVTDAATATSFDLLVYVVMPDHVHVLVQALHTTASAVRFVQRCKQMPGFLYKRRTGSQLWQASFYDRVVRKGDDAREMATYILANPVHAGLMANGDVWPYAGGTLVASEPRRG